MDQLAFGAISALISTMLFVFYSLIDMSRTKVALLIFSAATFATGLGMTLMGLRMMYVIQFSVTKLK